MSVVWEGKQGTRHLLMGNDAFARGIIEAGAAVAAGYPGTPSSEIIENLAQASKATNMYVEWSVNEKVAMEVAAAASFAGLRSAAIMKQVGVNVASDFMLHLSESGTRGGMVLISCEDPGALSSGNEGESRPFAKMFEIPLLEPGDFQEAKEITGWAFELSEKIRNLVMIRSVTRLSHASGNVTLGALPQVRPQAQFKHRGFFLDPDTGPVMTFPVEYKHQLMQQKLKQAVELFEDCPFNRYEGPDRPKVLIVTSSACYLYSKEAIQLLGAGDRVGLLKLGTTWPLPPKFMETHLSRSKVIFTVEEVLPFLEDNVKIMAADLAERIGVKKFHGRADGTLPTVNELNPDLVAAGLAKILGVPYQAVDPEYARQALECAFFGAPHRELAFCPGCPHRASFWSIHSALEMDGRDGFVCGDIGCYSMAFLPTGFSTLKTGHAMGSGTGIASGFGKLGRFGLDQPVLSVCGDSTFFHAAMPALVNAVHNQSDITIVVLDNSGTAMTGFQPHPGLTVDAAGDQVPALNIADVARAMGARVELSDPFDIDTTRHKLLGLLRKGGVNVLILKQICALSPEKKGRKLFAVTLDEAVCSGENCGCNKLCTRVFKCPGLKWDAEKKSAHLDEVICSGCGVCASICPSGAITKKEAA
ncbi:MAG: indolepyruvate ferredoxin oxidoreductase subunit alpha [Desulfobacteraceae bacterium]|nr:MAG: indolepyruvate ferredoxin oxidoreductase subunit alpha [Desulfobacteraceae bacterium]